MCTTSDDLFLVIVVGQFERNGIYACPGQEDSSKGDSCGEERRGCLKDHRGDLIGLLLVVRFNLF